MKNMKLVLMTVVVLCMATSMFAAEEVAGGGVKWGALSAALVLGVAAAAGAIGQGRAISAACEGIARNPARPARSVSR